ncbi:MAG: methyltransferase domain-containing protein [Myxococcota bacterium]|nr:methyltransferase domain-containing protein [Myxococcota bacterium]
MDALSFPRWIAERWVAAFGPDEAAALAAASNAAPPRTLRANRTRGSRDALLAELRTRFPDATACRFAPDGISLGLRGDPIADVAFREGRMTVQDEASQLVVELLDPQPGERVLDACAAPGAKATAIAERVGAAGRVIAMDRHPRRLALVARDAERLGLDCIAAFVVDASAPALAGLEDDAPFDRILVDAPCSGLGSLRRNPDARWRVQPEAIEALAAEQRAILAAVLPRLRRGGTLVYSTCTLTIEENESVASWLLAHAPDLRRVGIPELPASLHELLDADGALRCWPQRHDSDGFYAARFERRS